MALDLAALCTETHEPRAVAAFWAGVLGWDLADLRGAAGLVPTDDTGFGLRFLPTRRPKTGPNQFHLELTSESLDHQRETVDRALGLGARHLDVGQLPEEGHVVLADPGGNEFCVLGPGNSFLADCGFLGDLSGDGSRQTGCFWSEALGWPLVWDQDEETAIRSPHGGPKLTWGGPPLHPRTGQERVHLDVAPPPGGSRRAEVDRLLALGASHADIGQGEVGWTVLADPDGHELCVLDPPLR